MNDSRKGAAARRKAFSLLSIVAMTAAIAIPPWLALREARRQAYEVEAGIVLAYARERGASVTPRLWATMSTWEH